MNLVLLFPEDFVVDSKRVRLVGRRFQHIVDVHRVTPGDRLCVGLVDGKIGTGEVVLIDQAFVELDVDLLQPAPKPLELILVIALPRPQVVKRILLSAASLGIKKIFFLNFSRVEKSLWQSSVLRDGAITEQLILGLEQAKDTMMPEVKLCKRFKIFVEDQLPKIIKGSKALVAHPDAKKKCPVNVKGPVTLVIGPEGGLLDYELKSLKGIGFQAVHLGPRVLRVESALAFVAGRLF